MATHLDQFDCRSNEYAGYFSHERIIMPDFVYRGEKNPMFPPGTTRIVVAPSVTDIRVRLGVEGSGYRRPGWELVSERNSATTIRLHPQIHSLCLHAFTGFRNLTEMECISDLKRLKTIPHCAFEMCSALISIDLSGCVMLTRIQSQAFSRCFALKSIRLPESLTETDWL
jgi:BspA type Leucine rich repeat region (6 copies)